MNMNDKSKAENGILYVCGTPIGNLEDITLRVLRILREVDVIAAEDTRHTRKLLSHYEISKPLISCYQHNEMVRVDLMLKYLQDGKNIALVTDAGMPGISDPGSRVVEYMRKHEVNIEIVPGVSALTTAVVNSGFSADAFVFVGFWPRTSKDERLFIERLMNESKTAIVYESPYRLLSTIKSIAGNMPDRNICICRELTKKFEEIDVGPASEVFERWKEREVKGECVLVLDGAAAVEPSPRDLDDEEILLQVGLLVDGGMDRKSAIASVAKKFAIQKRRVYALVCKEKEEDGLC